ncbi:MAG: NAD(P)-dependent oxidoreductase [Patescibacteria group bacterium]
MNKMGDFFRGKKVLVTGGAGFVGTNLIIRLVELGAEVRATYHKKLPQYTNEGVDYIFADLTNGNHARRIVRSMDYVFMCAANTSGAAVMEKTPLVHVTPNVIMNSLMLEAAHQAAVKKFLFISSSAVYPVADHPVKEDEMEYGNLFSKYFFAGWMKQFSEVMCEMYAGKIKNPMPVVVVRPANLYGEYDDFEWATSHMVAANIRKVIERHNPIEVWGDGNDIKDLLYISDFVRGMLLAMEKLGTFEPINIATGVPVTVKDVLRLAFEIEGYGPRLIFYESKPTMIPKRLIDTAKAERLIGFRAETTLKEGLKRTIAWYHRRKNV